MPNCRIFFRPNFLFLLQRSINRSGPTIAIPFSLLSEATFRDRLRKVRAERGLTQKQLARQAGLAWDLVYRWERGMHGARPRNLEKVAGVLGVSVDYLLNGKSRAA